MIEDIVRQTGMSININSTTGGTHAPGSFHNFGQACDINEINNTPVSAQNPYVDPLQKAFSGHPNIAENFGPSARNERTLPNGQVVPMPGMAQGHPTHIHVSGQK